jgi:hypothetical protein
MKLDVTSLSNTRESIGPAQCVSWRTHGKGAARRWTRMLGLQLLSERSSSRQEWKKAISNGNFMSWPGVDTLSIESHLPKRSIASAKGHLDQERKNLQSTRVQLPTDEKDEDEFFPSPDATNVKSFAACAQVTCSFHRKKYLSGRVITSLIFTWK